MLRFFFNCFPLKGFKNNSYALKIFKVLDLSLKMCQIQ